MIFISGIWAAILAYEASCALWNAYSQMDPELLTQFEKEDELWFLILGIGGLVLMISATPPLVLIGIIVVLINAFTYHKYMD